MKDYMEFTDKQIIRLKNAIVLIDLCVDEPGDESSVRRDSIINALMTLGYAVKLKHYTNGTIESIEIVWEGFSD